MTTTHAEIHGVPRWSQVDNDWHGVAARGLIRRAGIRPRLFTR